MSDISDPTVLRAHALAPLAWRAAHRAAAFLRDERPADLAVESKSTQTDPVTEMDRGAEALVRETVLAERPDDGILGEEGSDDVGASGVRWVVDPIDGTVNYIYGLPLWGVSLAAEVDGVAQVGVIVFPALGESHVAVAGHGAWLVDDAGEHRLGVRSCEGLETALVATGFGYDSRQRTIQAAVAASLIGHVRDIRRSGSAVVDFCWLARGLVDAYYEQGLNRWDYAAGALIAREAGAVVTGLDGEDDLARFVVAATPSVAESLRLELVGLHPHLRD